MKYMHVTCGEHVADYLGEKPLTACSVVRSKEWIVLGEMPKQCSKNTYVCPRCGFNFSINSVCVYADEPTGSDK